MTTRCQDEGYEPPYTVEDLMFVTGLGRDSVREAIRSGELPGDLVGSKFSIPAEAFRRWYVGEWVPIPKRLFQEPIRPDQRKVTQIIRRRETA